MQEGGLLVVLGTRPEAIKLWPVICALRQRRQEDVTVLSTGQHRELLDPILAELDFRPDLALHVLRDRQSLDQLNIRLLKGIGPVLDELKPRRVVVQGDTATAAAAAMSAFHRQIPVAHVEAGLRTGNLGDPWPEEFNRRLISTVADLHFAPTVAARHALLNEGHDEKSVQLTGNTVVDAVRALLPVEHPAKDARKLIVVTLHRRENFERMPRLAGAIRTLSERPDVKVVLPLHANPVAAMLRRELAGSAVERIDALPYRAFLRLLAYAALVLTDSGGVQEGAVALGVPILVLRETTERMEAVVAGAARLVGTQSEHIVSEAHRLLNSADRLAERRDLFGDGNAAGRIAALLLSSVQREVA